MLNELTHREEQMVAYLRRCLELGRAPNRHQIARHFAIPFHSAGALLHRIFDKGHRRLLASIEELRACR